MTPPVPDHPVRLLIERLRHFGSYPSGVREIDESTRVRGTAFFPAGHGLWDHAGSFPPLPKRPLMLLGHNFGDVEAMEDAAGRGMEDLRGATWRNLLQILDEAQVSPSRCFFTNALMGLKDDGGGCRGALPDDPAYRQQCADFLRFQIEAIKPGCVLVMGEDAQQALAEISQQVRAAWQGPRGGRKRIKSLYTPPTRHLVPSVKFSDSAICAVALMYHPCDLRNLGPVWAETIALVQAAGALCGV